MTDPIDLSERRKQLIMSEPDDGLSAGPEVQDWAKSPTGQTPADSVQTWQPIETAPKNRMLLVGFFNSLGKWRSMHAQWRDDLPQHDDADDDDDPAPPGWYEGSLEAELLTMVRPTHWQFLPAPPVVQQQRETK